MASHIILNINDNAGYSPEQVSDDSISLQDLLAAVEMAIKSHGGDAKVVLSNGQKYGAGYGNISQLNDIFEDAANEDGVPLSELHNQLIDVHEWTEDEFAAFCQKHASLIDGEDTFAGPERWEALADDYAENGPQGI